MRGLHCGHIDIFGNSMLLTSQQEYYVHILVMPLCLSLKPLIESNNRSLYLMNYVRNGMLGHLLASAIGLTLY